MMIELYDILSKYGLTPTGIIHVGSHYGQEYPEYKRCGIKNIVFIEHNGFLHELSLLE
jgi:hypothetical protein